VARPKIDPRACSAGRARQVRPVPGLMLVEGASVPVGFPAHVPDVSLHYGKCQWEEAECVKRVPIRGKKTRKPWHRGAT
jgi:hypothetical protein